MATLIQKISRGNRKALTQSYEENKERIFYIAQSIDKSQASKATIWAFKNVWTDIISNSNIREDDFSKLVVLKLAGYLQRNSANAKKDTLDRCDKLSIEFSMNHENISIPNDVNATIYDTIDKIASPVESHDKTTAITVTIITAVVVACIVAMSFLFSKIDVSENDDDVELVGNEELLSNNNKYTNTNGLNNSNNSNSSTKEPETSAISATIDKSLTYYADIVIEDYGTITVELDYEAAPITVANFVGLAQSGFYDGLTFHRIIEGFMMQGGDPNGNGTGGSKDNIYGEFIANGWNNEISHKKGVISMARATDMNSASSQFFIMHEDSPHLDGQYAAFGHVVKGIEVVDDVCESAEPTDKNGTISSNNQPVIKTITIRTEEKE